MYAIFTKRSEFCANKITEDVLEHYDLREDTEEERELAKEEGYNFVHLFERKEDDYDMTYYEYVSSECL